MASISKHFTISSSLDEITRVDSILENIFQQLSVNEESQNDILLATTEGITNAILHGNNEDPEKTVTISINAKPNQISIEIEDEGPGFDPDKVPDPTNDSNLLKTGGRGVFLIKEYADDVTYNSKGNRVTITFNLHE